MDVLSRLLWLDQTQVSLDVRCLLAGDFALPHEALPPGEAGFHLVLSGRCLLQTPAGLLPMQGGDFVLLPHGDAHALVDAAGRGLAGRSAAMRSAGGGVLPLQTNRAPGDAATADGEAMVDLVCGRYLHAAGGASLLTPALPAVMHVTLAQSLAAAPMAALTAWMREEAAAALPGGAAVVNACGQALLTLALRAYVQSGADGGGVLALAADERLGPSVHAVLDEPGADWSIERLARRAAMSRATYARRFQEVAGTSVGDFLLRARMRHACVLLARTRRDQADIAQAVGYRSEAAFGQAFRRLMGEPPGRWRRGRRHPDGA